jgi:hypothetical protein
VGPGVTLRGTALAPSNVELKPQSLRFDKVAPTLAHSSSVQWPAGGFHITGENCEGISRPRHLHGHDRADRDRRTAQQDTRRFVDSAGRQDASLTAG